MKPADRNALEFAIQIAESGSAEKEKNEVVALSLAGPEGEGLLKEAMALGADRAAILSDPSFLQGEETAVSTFLAHACLKIGADLVLCGEGQVGHRVAEEMKIPSISSVFRIESDPTGLKIFSGSPQDPAEIFTRRPLLAGVLAGSNTPRIANAIKIMKASKKEVLKWTPADIDLPPGAGVSGMEIVRTFSAESP